jgi:hypothetical protein
VTRPTGAPEARTRLPLFFVVVTVPLLGCGEAPEAEDAGLMGQLAIFQGSDDFCSLPQFELDVLAHVPGADSPPVDDVNWT